MKKLIITISIILFVSSTNVINALTESDVSSELEENVFQGLGQQDLEEVWSRNVGENLNTDSVDATAMFPNGDYLIAYGTKSGSDGDMILTRVTTEGVVVFEKNYDNTQTLAFNDMLISSKTGNIYVTGLVSNGSAEDFSLAGFPAPSDPVHIYDGFILEIDPNTGNILNLDYFEPTTTGSYYTLTYGGKLIEDSEGNIVIAAGVSGSSTYSTYNNYMYSEEAILKYDTDLNILDNSTGYSSSVSVLTGSWSGAVTTSISETANGYFTLSRTYRDIGLATDQDLAIVEYDNDFNVVNDTTFSDIAGVKMAYAHASTDETTGNILIVGRENNAETNYPIRAYLFDSNLNLITESVEYTPDYISMNLAPLVHYQYTYYLHNSLVYNNGRFFYTTPYNSDTLEFSILSIDANTLDVNMFSENLSTGSLSGSFDTGGNYYAFTIARDIIKFTYDYAPIVKVIDGVSVNVSDNVVNENLLSLILESVTDDNTAEANITVELLYDDANPYNALKAGTYPIYIKATDNGGYETIALTHVTVIEDSVENPDVEDPSVDDKLPEAGNQNYMYIGLLGISLVLIRKIFN